VETALASTARALAKQTETENGYTATPAVIPTDTPTPTPKISSAGTSLESLADGSTRFTDYTAGIQVVFPSNWLAIRVGEPEYYQAWEKETTKSPIFENIFVSMQNTDPNLFRVTAVDIRSEQVTDENFSKVEVVFSPNDTRTLNQIRTFRTENHAPLAKYKLLSSSLKKTPEGLDTAIIEFQWESASSDNVKFVSYYKEILFKVPSGIVAIQLFTVLEQKDTIRPEFDQIVGNMVFITP